MTESKYAKFTEEQFAEYKTKLHSKVHWLLVYKEENYAEDVLLNYFNSVMSYIGSLNEVFEYNPLVIDLLVTLQVSLDELSKQDFCFKVYRKNILEAHNIIDRL